MHTLPPSCLPVCSPGNSAKATAHPASCLFACLLARLLCPGYSTQATAQPATCLPSCLLAAQATLPRLLNTLPPACLSVCWTGYSTQATANPATCMPAFLLARLFCPGYCTPCRLPACPFAGQATLPSKPCRLTACLPACWPRCSAQATLPRLLHTLPPAFLPVCWPGYSAMATAHPATCLLGAQATLPRLLNTLPPACLFAGQATLPRLMHTLRPACLPVCWPGYSGQQTLPPDFACLRAGQAVYSAQATAHPDTCLPAFLLARLLAMATATPCHLPVRCPGYSAQATEHPASCLPVCWPGYSAQANAHPATCLPACLLARLLCPGYCTPCHLPVCLFAGQAIVPRLLCPGYCTPCHLPAFLPVSCQATLPRLLNTLPPACLSFCWTGYSAQATAHPATCLPACLLARLLCPGYCTPCRLPACPFAGQATLPSKPCRLTACLPASW